MSIYQAWYRRSWGSDLVPPARPRAGYLPPMPPGIGLPGPDWTRLRKTRPVDYLLPASLRWFKSLPQEVRPVALARRYARIVNLIAQQWNDYDACRGYFDELLNDRRGNRQGFPEDVERDLRKLLDYFVRLRLAADGGPGLA